MVGGGRWVVGGRWCGGSVVRWCGGGLWGKCKAGCLCSGVQGQGGVLAQRDAGQVRKDDAGVVSVPPKASGGAATDSFVEGQGVGRVHSSPMAGAGWASLDPTTSPGDGPKTTCLRV